MKCSYHKAPTLWTVHISEHLYSEMSISQINFTMKCPYHKAPSQWNGHKASTLWNVHITKHLHNEMSILQSTFTMNFHYNVPKNVLPNYFTPKMTFVAWSDSCRVSSCSEGNKTKQPSPPLPVVSPLNELHQRFLEFFHRKVQTIRNNFDRQVSSLPSSCTEPCFHGRTLRNFGPVSKDLVKRTILISAAKACDLEAFPTRLLLECPYCLLS